MLGEFHYLSLDREILLRACYGVVYPIMSYGITVWGPVGKPLTNRIFVLQKRAVRIIYNLGYRKFCKKTFRQNRLLTLFTVCLNTIIFITEQNQICIKSLDVHQYETCSSLNYHRINTSLKGTDKSPFLMGAILFKRLPYNLKVLRTYLK